MWQVTARAAEASGAGSGAGNAVVEGRVEDVGRGGYRAQLTASFAGSYNVEVTAGGESSKVWC